LSGVVDIILFDSRSLAEPKLADRLGLAIAGRKHLEHDLRRDAGFNPLLVRPTIALGTPKNDHRVGRGTDLGLSLFWIPQEIARDKHVGIVAENGLQSLRDGDDPLKLERVIRHWLPVTVGILDRRPLGRTGRDAHDLDRA
jgi:hypothetical protein